jgi:hypothetical protein
VNALRGLFSKLPAVKAAYLAECAVAHTDDRPHMVIGIAGADDLALIVRAAGGVARHYLARGEYVDFVRIEDTTLAAYMLNETEPFYRRRHDA